MVILILKNIYKITNLLNGKIYIGQSVNPENRWKQHQCSDSVIGNAIRKYGVENFSFEIIEENIENYNERERFWIDFYNSNNKKFGYNLTSGGENPPIFLGENSNISKYTDAFVEAIKQDLLNANMNFQEIMNKYQISDVYLSMLNRGKFRKDPNYSYPIRKHGNETTPIDVVMRIIHELQYTTKTTREIAKENNIGEVLIWEINTGRKQKLPDDIEYPIRYPYHIISKKLAETLIKELQDNKYQFAQIAKMYNISYPTISRFNRGKICKNPNLDYPIRPRSKKVCKPVETIPS